MAIPPTRIAAATSNQMNTVRNAFWGAPPMFVRLVGLALLVRHRCQMQELRATDAPEVQCWLICRAREHMLHPVRVNEARKPSEVRPECDQHSRPIDCQSAGVEDVMKDRQCDQQ
ncbi:hypothetical protein KEM52_005703 [Ascosphaera acerosa]|nr:hypothetical protein KEM52_005703 [Ascosphaera acerosa]